MANTTGPTPPRHCERSEAIHLLKRNNIGKIFAQRMTDKFTLALIDNAFLPSEFAEIAARAEAAGHVVLGYPHNIAFLAATNDHPRIHALLCMGNTPCDAALLAAMERLRALLSAVTGIEGFDASAATAHGIVIGNGQTEKNYVGMAESTILLILAALYDMNHTQSLLRHNLPRPSPLRARLLQGLTVGLVGFGKIAQETARRLTPFGVTLLVNARRPNPMIAECGAAQVGLEALLRQSDIVSLHCALNAQTRHILNADRLALMKPSAVLINTSRGALVDEPYLITALQTGKLSFAALDTFETEPLPPDSKLRDLPNVILTPHMIGHTADCNLSLLETAWQSICNVAAGEPPVFIKNPEVLSVWRARVAA